MTTENRLAELERDRLAELERVVERGLGTFREVGAALLEIRECCLYRTTHATFEAYCRERWNLSRSYAYRLTSAAAIAELVSPIGDIETEWQARELAPLRDEPERMREVFAEAQRRAGGRSPTAALLREAVETIGAVHTPPEPLDEDALRRRRVARVADEQARLAKDLDEFGLSALASRQRALARDVEAEARS